MSTPNSTDALFANVLKHVAPAKELLTQVSQEGQAASEPGAEQEDADTEQAPQVSELDMLKNRARLMGLTFSNNIGIDSLKSKIAAKLAGEADKDETVVVAAVDPRASEPSTASSGAVAPVKNARQQMYDEQMKLVRVRITNLNPSKKDLPGEIFTFANKVLGAVRKYIPYGEATENGYHIPLCIYTQLKEREFLNIKTRKDSRGRVVVETGMAREFALEVLPALTERELAQLAASQAASKGMD